MILDANVVIALLDADDVHYSAAAGILVDHAGSPFRTHPVTLAESLVAHVRAGTADVALDRLARLGVDTLQAPDRAVDLARLRADTRLKMPDCLPLLAAETSATPLATFDARLAGAARARGVPVVGA